MQNLFSKILAYPTKITWIMVKQREKETYSDMASPRFHYADDKYFLEYYKQAVNGSQGI